MSPPPPRRGSNWPNRFGPPMERDPNLPVKSLSPTTNTPSPSIKSTKTSDMYPSSLPIPIPVPTTNSHLGAFATPRPEWTHSNAIPSGRPNLLGRNRRGLTISTIRPNPNPFLDREPFFSSPKKSSSNVNMLAQSPTTPNRRMIFPIEMPNEERAGGGGRPRVPEFVRRLKPEVDGVYGGITGVGGQYGRYGMQGSTSSRREGSGDEKESNKEEEK